MSESPNIPLETRVYEIRKGNNNLDEILAYQTDQKKEFIYYTFQTRREIPEVLEIYRENRDEYYPAAFIIPSPSPKMSGQSIPFDGNFFLFVGYAKDIPPNLPLYNLFLTYHIEITEKNKLEMRINGFIGLDILRVLNILQNHKDPEKYISYLEKEYILYLENITNLEDLNSFITYNKEYLKIIGKNKILRYNKKDLRSNGENKIIKKGWFIVIDDDTSKNNEFTPTYVKIFEMFV